MSIGSIIPGCGKIIVKAYAKQGPPGPPGPAGATYTHTQSSAATTWTINHNLGFKPSVEVLDTGGNEFEAQVLHSSVNQVILYFNTAKAGTARLT